MSGATVLSEKMFTHFQQELGCAAKQLGLTTDIFCRPDIKIPIETYYKLLELSVKKKTDIGFYIGKTLNTEDFGALGHTILAAKNVEQGLSIMSQYMDVLEHDTIVRIDKGVDNFIIGYRYDDSTIHESTHGSTQDIPLATTFIIKMLRSISGKNISPSLVEMTISRPRYSAELLNFYDCSIAFGAKKNRIYYNNSILNTPIISADISLFNALEYYLSEQIKVRATEKNLINKIRHLIRISLSEGTPNIDVIAKKLGLSRRTLQRRLTCEDISFSFEVESIREKIAIEYIENSQLSFTDIALVLGYGELSSFSRAFRRWTYLSPQEYKNQKLLA